MEEFMAKERSGYRSGWAIAGWFFASLAVGAVVIVSFPISAAIVGIVAASSALGISITAPVVSIALAMVSGIFATLSWASAYNAYKGKAARLDAADKSAMPSIENSAAKIENA